MPVIRFQNGNGESNVYYEFDPGQKPLGEGGMGRVFRGVQVEEGSNGSRKERDVAIKCLLEDLPDHAIKRSRREASIRLKNDSLVEMIDFVETHDGYVTHYHVVSELLDGVNLDELLEGRTTNHDGNPNPTAERLLHNYRENRKAFVGEVFRSILSGIMALHDAGYIHRDIDPSNIMVTSDGKIKLIDFGIAKKVNELFTTGKSLTSPGQFIGKPYYAAPELLLGDLKQQSYTTDVYALGIVLFQLMTGHLPFEGTFQEVYEKQMKEDLPLNEVEDKAVRKIIEKATEKDQKKRYQTSAEFRVDLDRWIAGSSEPEPDPKPVGKWIGIALGCIVVIGLIVIIATRPQDPPKPDENHTQTLQYDTVNDKTDTVINIVKEKKSVASVVKAKQMLMDKSKAKEGWDMLNQLAEKKNYDAVFLKSRIYFDPKAVKDNKGNEFYDKNWETMRENCGEEADNVKAHDLLMDAFGIKETDPILLYELGCDFLWKERGNVQDLGCALYCFNRVENLATKGSQYYEAAQSKIERINGSPKPPKEEKKPTKKTVNLKRAESEEDHKPLL